MAGTKARRVALWAGAVIVVLLLAVVGGGLFVVHEMKARVLETLGPLGSAEDIDVGYARITLSRVRLRGPQGWPTDDTLRAERVTLNVDMRALLSNRVHLQHVTVDGFYLSVVRFADGRVELLPNLRQSTREAQAGSSEAAAHAQEDRLIDHVTLRTRRDGILRSIRADAALQDPDFRRAGQRRQPASSRPHGTDQARHDRFDQRAVAHGHGRIQRLDENSEQGFADAHDLAQRRYRYARSVSAEESGREDAPSRAARSTSRSTPRCTTTRSTRRVRSR